MGEQETIGGVPVTDQPDAEWAAEAKDGFDIAAIKKRGRGRPGRGAGQSQVVALRLTVKELAALTRHARRQRA